MQYHDWVERVLRCVLEHEDRPTMFGMQQIGEELGLDVGSWGDPERRSLHDAIAVACMDLEDFDLLDVQNQYRVSSTLRARRYSRESLRDIWSELREGHLEPEDERFLRGVAALSLAEHDDWAEARETTTLEVFNFLQMPWDRGRSIDFLKVTDGYYFTKSMIPLGDQHTVRIRWAGAVRVNDAIGDVLQEPRAHLAAGRIRAAGCIAGVVLEGHLKYLCGMHSAPVVVKLPTLSDYNDAARKAKLYPQTTWRRIQHLTDLRNLCAHVLDREPTYQDASELLEGTDDVLRELAAIPPPD